MSNTNSFNPEKFVLEEQTDCHIAVIKDLRQSLKLISEDASRPADPIRQKMCQRLADMALDKSKLYEQL